jgi:3-hydroxyisobutyrate dehydrogenase
MASDGGGLEAIRDDAVWVQATTVGLEATDRLAAHASERGVTFADCPVLGTKQPAEQGELTVLASGPEEVRERCAPIFDAIGSRTLWLGAAGAGTRMKLVANAWLLALTAALGEALVLAEALDLDPGAFLEMIDGAPMGLPYAQIKGRAMLEDRLGEANFRLALAEKDARLMLEAAESLGLSPAVMRSVRESYARAREAGHGDEDMAAVYRVAAGR